MSAYDEEQTFTHPSYGMVGLSHRQGHTKLFGSHLDHHDRMVALTIHRAERKHHLSQDWYHANEELIEILLSPAQFADMLTSPNQGFGVPCTIRFIRSEGPIPEVPEDEKTETRTVVDNFKAKLKDLQHEMTDDIEQARTILEKKSLSKEDRKALLGLVQKPARFLWDHATFVADQFTESVGKVVTAGKKEVEAAFTQMVHRAGLQHLVEQGQLRAPQVLALAAPQVQDAEVVGEQP